MSEVGVETINNPNITSIAHDWFEIEGEQYGYETGENIGMITKRERDFLNKTTAKQIHKRYGLSKDDKEE